VIKAGADGIAADVNYEWLYCGLLSGHTIYRARFADLLDESLSDAELDARVYALQDLCKTRLGEKGFTRIDEGFTTRPRITSFSRL